MVSFLQANDSCLYSEINLLDLARVVCVHWQLRKVTEICDSHAFSLFMSSHWIKHKALINNNNKKYIHIATTISLDIEFSVIILVANVDLW